MAKRQSFLKPLRAMSKDPLMSGSTKSSRLAGVTEESFLLSTRNLPFNFIFVSCKAKIFQLKAK